MSASSVNASSTLSVPELTSAYDNVSTASKAVETIVMVVIITVTIVGNVCLWVVVLRSKALRNLTNMFILGLSTADLLVGLTNMPITVYTIIKGRWEFSHSACVVFGFLNMITLVTSVMSLCNISINRYVMVCYPQKFKDIYTVRNSVLMVIGVVIFSILLSLPPLIGWSEYVYTPSHSFCFADWQNHMSYAFFMIGCKKNRKVKQTSSKASRNRSTIVSHSENISTESNLTSFKRLTLNMSFLRPTEAPSISNNNSHLTMEPNKEYQRLSKPLSCVDVESMSITAANLDPLHNTLIPCSSEVHVTQIRVRATTTLHTPSDQSPNSTLTHKPRNRLLHPNWKHSSEKQKTSIGSPEPSISIEPSSDVLLVVPSNSEVEINGQSSENDAKMEIPKSRQSSSRRREEIRLAFFAHNCCCGFLLYVGYPTVSVCYFQYFTRDMCQESSICLQ